MPIELRKDSIFFLFSVHFFRICCVSLNTIQCKDVSWWCIGKFDFKYDGWPLDVKKIFFCTLNSFSSYLFRRHGTWVLKKFLVSYSLQMSKQMSNQIYFIKQYITPSSHVQIYIKRTFKFLFFTVMHVECKRTHWILCNDATFISLTLAFFAKIQQNSLLC